jgi:hypothetical protein
MAETFVGIDSAARAIQIKFGMNKDVVDLSCLMEATRFYVPRGNEMGADKNLAAWDPYMFLTDADYYESEGFKEERYPRETAWCIHRNKEVPITMDVFGKHVTIDDPEYETMVNGLLAFPPRIYKEAGNLLLATMQKYINTDEMQVDTNEPFGAFILFQREIIFTLVKTCLENATSIQNMLLELQRFPIKSRTDATSFKKEAELVLLLNEISQLAPKRSHDRHFINNVMQNMAEHLNSFSEPQKNMMAETLASMGRLNRQNNLNRETMFEKFRDAFRVQPGSTLMQQCTMEANLAPPEMALVSSAPPPATKRDFLKKTTQPEKEPSASIQDIMNLLLVQNQKLDRLKGEITILHDKIGKINGNGATSEHHNKRRNSQRGGGAKAFVAAVGKTNGKQGSTKLNNVAKELPTYWDSSADDDCIGYANLAQMNPLYSPLTPGPTSCDMRLDGAPLGSDSPRGSGLMGPSIYGPPSRATRKDECAPTAPDDSCFRTLCNRDMTAADHNSELRSKLLKLDRMDTGSLHPSGGTYPLPSAIIGWKFADDEARITLKPSNGSPPPCVHLYKERISKTCSTNSSPGKQLDTSQNEDVPDLCSESSDDALVCIESTFMKPQLSNMESVLRQEYDESTIDGMCNDLSQTATKPRTRSRTRMDSYNLPSPLIPEEDDDGVLLDPKQPKQVQNMEVDQAKRDKVKTSELHKRKATPNLDPGDYDRGLYTQCPYGLRTTVPPGYNRQDMAAAEERFREYDKAAAEARFNEFLRHYGTVLDATSSHISSDQDDGEM